METTPIKRRLTAILAADAVGYSRRMGEDEEGTMRQLAAHRAVIDRILLAHEGRIVSTAGDSVLAEFPSSVEAVRCAVEIQDALETRNQAVPEAERLVFRIGINLGDVMVDGADILGDGVNVAARLESIAEPGGICISSSVYDQISGKLNLGFTDIGDQSLKNIARPIHAYRFDRSGGTARPRPPAARRARGRAATIAAGVAVLAVALAFAWQAGWFERRPAVPEAAGPPPTPRAADAASEETRMKLQIAEAERARAEAELARARAEAETARQKAVEVAKAASARSAQEARTAPAAPPRAAPAPPAPAQASPKAAGSEPPAPPPVTAPATAPVTAPAVGSAPAPPTAPTTVAATAAIVTGVAKWQCEAYDEIRAFSSTITYRYADGEYEIVQGSPGVPGYVTARGKPTADGRLTLSGNIVGRSTRFRGQRLPARFEGSLAGAIYDMRGTIGKRGCTLQLPAEDAR